MDLNELALFLFEAKQMTYANIGSASKAVMTDGGTELMFNKSSYVYRDRYYGGEPFSGEEVVIKDNRIIWVMNYRGKVVQNCPLSNDEVYGFLQNALKHPAADLPSRGPEEYNEGSMAYNLTKSGILDHFYGTEMISYNGFIIYEGFFHGGIVG